MTPAWVRASTTRLVVVLSFDAPRQFPDSRVDVQLDEDLELDDLAVASKDNDG